MDYLKKQFWDDPRRDLEALLEAATLEGGVAIYVTDPGLPENKCEINC